MPSHLVVTLSPDTRVFSYFSLNSMTTLSAAQVAIAPACSSLQAFRVVAEYGVDTASKDCPDLSQALTKDGSCQLLFKAAGVAHVLDAETSGTVADLLATKIVSEGAISLTLLLQHKPQDSRVPHISLVSENVQRRTIIPQMDVVVVAPLEGLARDLYADLQLKIHNQLRKIRSVLQANSLDDYGCRVYHFHHDQFLKVSAAYATPLKGKIDESKLVDVRRSLHDRLSVPKNQPRFRIFQSSFQPPVDTQGRLQNTHIGLPSSGVAGGTEHIVTGVYEYYHYMQGHLDDNGWGCAYRSLQTICSWFIRQGFTSLPPPTHRQIQQVLVDMGDKEPAFVGSKQWIGSMELGWVLETWYKDEFPVVCKYIAQVQGDQISDKARELVHHFDSQGTPIMIGGAAMAHTILGVDFNPDMGKIKFLVLDPHYIGPENLQVIQSKGWCSWKGPEFWNPTAPYNLCLPQRPPVY